MKWKIRLAGNEGGLETLAESFTDDPEIFREDENFFPWSSQFEDPDLSIRVRTEFL